MKTQTKVSHCLGMIGQRTSSFWGLRQTLGRPGTLGVAIKGNLSIIEVFFMGYYWLISIHQFASWIVHVFEEQSFEKLLVLLPALVSRLTNKIELPMFFDTSPNSNLTFSVFTFLISSIDVPTETYTFVIDDSIKKIWFGFLRFCTGSPETQQSNVVSTPFPYPYFI